MARRKRSKVFPRRFGAAPAEHAARARGGIRSIRELTRIARENIAKGDCVRATSALLSLAQEEGAYEVDRAGSGGRKSPAGFPSDRLYVKFTKACIRATMPQARSFGRRK